MRVKIRKGRRGYQNVEGFATRHALFVITPRADGMEAYIRPKMYGLTHKPTGYNLGGVFGTKAEMRRFADLLARIPIPWEKLRSLKAGKPWIEKFAAELSEAKKQAFISV